MTDRNRLEGLNAVVTGGNRGIGRALATGLARAGAAVAIWARDPRRGSETVHELEILGARAICVPCDVTEPDQVASAMQQTVAELGPLGSLFANAGIARPAPITETTLEDWHAVLRTNLDGAFLCAREAARRFIEQGSGGSIILVSSTASRYGAAGQAAYATSKSGILGLGRTLAVELARHRVRSNVLVPGWTATDMNADLRQDERFLAATTRRTPVRRWAEPGEFEAVAAYLADPALTFHTGAEIVVDGGYSVF